MKTINIAILVLFILILWIVMFTEGYNIVQTGKPLYKSLLTFFGGQP